MKTRILIFLSLVAAGVGILSLVNSPAAYAGGESYTWNNETTIEAKGGNWGKIEFGGKPVANVQFKRVSEGTYTATNLNLVEGSNICKINFRLVVGTDFIGANLTYEAPDSGPICEQMADDMGFDKRVLIANPQNGPSMPGSEVDYTTVNCAVAYEGDQNIDRCIAIKSCVVDHKKAVLDCLRSWNTCLINRTVNGGVLPDKREECVKLITAGNLDGASKGATPGGTTENKTTCVIPGIGWILCPVLYIMAELTNGAYAFVSALLTVQPILTTGNSEGLYKSWLVMRNFANVAFVIAFLIIIFSQVTSAGISNYGIKKLLPRLIIAAILVNLSYWICAAAVDLSNIGGSSLKGLFDAIGATIELPDAGAAATGEGWLGIVGGLLAGGLLTGAALYIGLSALIPVLIGVLITIAIVFIALIMRQALIILLIVISPMAFVAYLLPNTESMFNRWRSLFWTLLLMYPIISLIFGASALASKIVMGSA